MKNDFATSDWADHHSRFNNGLANAIRTIMDAMNVLHAKQFDAPWRDTVTPRDCTSR